MASLHHVSENEVVSPELTEAPEATIPTMPVMQIDDSKAQSSYANFCRVTGTPEELILDIGLNPHPRGGFDSPIMIDQRCVISFFTAKRLYQAIGVALSRHEGTFGVIETDVQKRVHGGR